MTKKTILQGIIFIAMLLLFFPQIANCEKIYFINSDETTYVNNYVYCKGNVVVMYCGKILSADNLSYDQKKEIVCASGNIIIKDEMKNVYLLDSIIIEKNFTSGSGENIKIIMSDKSRLAAKRIIIKNKKFELSNVIYTPCYECLIENELTWKIKSRTVTFDPNSCIEYTDSEFDFLGQTILYLPHLSHPSPKIKRKTGFLTPKFSMSDKSGFSIIPRYFISISDYQELILKPIITTKIGSVGWLYYGNRFKNGEFYIDTSITGTKSVNNYYTDKENQKFVEKIQRSGYRGHIFSKMKYEINDVWRCGFDINLASDRYYLKRFPFLESPNRILESKIILEGFDGCNYTSIKTSMFQSEDMDILPKVIPIIERNYYTDLFGGTINIDTMFLNLDFPNARSAQKLSSNISWSKEFMMPNGSILDFKGLVSFRAMKVKEREKTNYDSCTYMAPQITASWRWPLLFTYNNTFSTIITPIVGVVIASTKKHFDAFEDPFCEINDINIMEGSRAISPYNIDYGNRLCYALKFSSYIKGKNILQFLIGRSTELSSLSKKLDATGLKYKNSNIITSLDMYLSDDITFLVKGSYSTKTSQWLKLESGLCFAYKKFETDILAFNGDQYYFNPFAKDIETISDEKKVQSYKGYMANFGWKATKSTKLKAGIAFDNVHNKIVKHNIGFELKNECTYFEISLERTNYHHGDLKPDSNVRIAIHLKNLGI